MNLATHSTNGTRRRASATIGVGLLAALALAGCSSASNPSAETADPSGSAAASAGGTVTLITHDSFPTEDFAAAASAATGYDVKVVTAGDGGELTSKLVLTKDAPVADAFYGVDNSFASRLVTEGVTAPYTSRDLPESAAPYAYDDSGALTPIDHGAVCFNIDTGWFADNNMAPPATLDDLASPQYAPLTVVIDPTASSTGAAFLIGTVAEYGPDGFTDYWTTLLDNGASVSNGWEDAYYGEFSGAAEGGTKPIVLSYSSSPAATLTEDGSASTTEALLDTCTSQIEYAGVVTGAANPQGAQAVIDYLLSSEFQATIPDAMYMYPVNDAAGLPDAWAKFAPAPTAPHDVPPAEIADQREQWLREWSDATGL